MDERVQIFISSHKPCERAESGFVRTVMQADVIRDLEGGDEKDRFMAAHANEFCELLTQYWAWKRCGAPYVGFGHYRRYFAFAAVAADGDGIVRRVSLNAETVRELALADDAAIAGALDGCDVLAPYPVEYPVGSAYRQYKNSDVLNVEDLDAVLGIIERDYPEYRAAAKRYMRGRRLYYCNMFVMRRELFLSYSEWLFAVLFRFYGRKDMRAAGYTAAQLRTPGHLGERLFGIWLTRLQMQGGAKIRHCRMAVFENAESMPPLLPEAGALPLFLPATARSAPFAAAALRSAALSSAQKISAVFLDNGVSEADRDRLAASVADCSNVSVRFAEAARVFAPCAASRRDVTADPSRLPAAFPAFGRILWSDGFSLVRADIAEYAAGEGVIDLSARGEQMPARARREYYPTKGYSEYFRSVFRGTAFYGEKDRAEKCGAERNLFWRALFRVFPEGGKFGCFLRKVRRHLKR